MGWWIVGSLCVVVIGALMWVGVRALLAKTELQSAVPLAAKIQDEIVAGNAGGASQASKDLSSHAASAASLTSDPVWKMFEFVPMLGENLRAVRQLAAVVDDISTQAIQPLSAIASGIQVSDFKPVDGAVNVQPLIDAQTHVAAANAALARAEREVRSIDTSGTISVVTNARAELQSAVENATDAVGVADRAVRLIPTMLGASGPRNYLLLFQNPAELRASGGIPGAVALVHTDSGRMELTQQASASSFPRYKEPVLELPADSRGIYGDIMGQYMQDVTLTPDFATSGKLAREMWRLQYGVEADGVLSIDPVALSYLLKATGPITLSTGDVLSSDNAVKLLLSDAYARYDDPQDQDAFFAAAAASVFSAVSSGNTDPKALIQALAKAGGEHRMLVWSAHEEDQAVLADTALAGGLPRSDAHTNRFGVYLNDATGAKMDMYLDVKIGVGQVTCRQDKRPNYGVSVTLTNTAPADAATALPEYVTGGGAFGVAPGNVKTLVSVYGVPGMQNLGLTRDGAAIAYHPTTDSAHPVSLVSVELAPGESTVLTFGWLGPNAFVGDVLTQSTPVIYRNDPAELALTCESPLW
ncbi:DUF4012 domain-containing protein [Glaciibacter sp. 2TAF33]|uniref:DUF4012 domain-containing protein n=1 Tax=Glaciibacter sp. 2TAF33 TaxID=3233015 RepID=UPI003F92BE14